MDNQQGSAPAGNPDGAAGQQQAPWYQSFPDEVRGLVETKGWQTPVDAITSYANLVFRIYPSGSVAQHPCDRFEIKLLHHIFGHHHDESGE